MRSPVFISILLLILIIIDFYIYQVLKHLLQTSGSGVRTVVSIVYWTLCVLSFASFVLVPFYTNPYFRQYFFSMSMGWMLTQLVMTLIFYESQKVTHSRDDSSPWGTYVSEYRIGVKYQFYRFYYRQLGTLSRARRHDCDRRRIYDSKSLR